MTFGAILRWVHSTVASGVTRPKTAGFSKVELVAHELEYAGSRVRLVVAQDISERQQLEEQFRQAQKWKRWADSPAESRTTLTTC